MSSPFAQAFGQRLRNLRDELGFCQREVAEQAGLALSHVQRLEYGQRSPTFETALSLADGLGVSVDALRPGGKENSAIPEKSV